MGGRDPGHDALSEENQRCAGLHDTGHDGEELAAAGGEKNKT